ncbi:serine acetyltransferase [Kineococcus sp. SYSU DK001]|uniref:serine acetyltransferase n=1 Tax=Kineococcus sp. SYSU DK001 TaxID=3383122 RepID=UPI003D7EBACF
MPRLRDAVERWKSGITADFPQNPYWESRVTLSIWRFGQLAHLDRSPAGFVARRVHTLADTVWTRALIGAELPRSVQAGPGLRLPHAGRGVILHPATRMGRGVTLYHRVTVGVSGDAGPPTIGDDVYLGTGAAVIGAVNVGRGARVGANAVVVRDVPDGFTSVGVPGRLLPPRAERTGTTTGESAAAGT